MTCSNGTHCYHYPEGVWCSVIPPEGTCCHCGASTASAHGPYRPRYGAAPYTTTTTTVTPPSNTTTTMWSLTWGNNTHP